MTDADPTQFPRDFPDRWEAAWNSHDTEQVLALVHPEIEWDDRTFWPEVVHGREELREYIDAIWRAMPDVAFEEVERFRSDDGRRGVYLFRQTGSAPPRLGTGGRFDTCGCDVFLGFQDGLLKRYMAAYDIVRMLEQMEALPARDGRLGGAYVMSLAQTGA